MRSSTELFFETSAVSDCTDSSFTLIYASSSATAKNDALAEATSHAIIGIVQKASPDQGVQLAQKSSRMLR